jgi:cholesterol transport system auxiliary component
MKSIRLSLALTLALGTTSCEITPKQPAVHDFGLPLTTQGITSKSTPTIDIDAPKWIWDNRIRYRLLFKSPTKVNFYMLDRWIASPPELFKQQLQTHGKFLHYPLSINFLDFEQQFETPKKTKVIAHFTVTASSPDNKHTIATQEFYLHRYTQTPDAKGAVEGFSYLINQAISDVDSWLANLP